MPGYHFKDPVLITQPIRECWKVNEKLTGAQTAHVLKSPSADDKCLRVADCILSVSEASEVNLFFGDGTGDYDVYLTVTLAAGIPFTMPSPANVRPGGGPGDDLQVTTTAGNLYINLIGVEERCLDCEEA
jgi:hypothetical protein